MTELPPVIEPPSHRDRSGGLKGFGILLIFLGGLCALMTLLTLLVVSLVPAPSSNALPPIYAAPRPSLALPMAVYISLAVGLIWLGVGSVRAQRWARTLIMIFSWSGLYFGILMSGLIVFIVLNFTPPPAAQANTAMIRTVAMIFMTAFMGIFFVGLPGWMAWFYTKKDVKATCEARHEKPSWTDSRPPTVLFMTLWQAFGAASLVFLPFSYHGTMPQFGTIFTGGAGTVICVVEAVLLAASAFLYYRLAPAGWWLMLGLLAVLFISGILNVLSVDYNALYTAMGYSSAQLDNMQKFNFMRGGLGAVFIIISVGPSFALLAWTRRYFAAIRPAQA